MLKIQNVQTILFLPSKYHSHAKKEKVNITKMLFIYSTLPPTFFKFFHFNWQSVLIVAFLTQATLYKNLYIILYKHFSERQLFKYYSFQGNATPVKIRDKFQKITF